MTGEGSVDDRTVGEAAEGVRKLLAAIDAGEVSADDVQRAYLAGSADVLDRLAGTVAEP